MTTCITFVYIYSTSGRKQIVLLLLPLLLLLLLLYYYYYLQVVPAYGICSLLFCGAYHRGTGKYSKTQAIAVQPDTHLLLGREGAHTGKVPCPT